MYSVLDVMIAVSLSCQCLSSLEMALSQDFAVQSSPLYQLILGRARRDTGDMDAAQDCLLRALSLSKARMGGWGPSGVAVSHRGSSGGVGGISRGLSGGGAGGASRGSLAGKGEEEELSRSEVAMVHLELVSILTKLGRKVRICGETATCTHVSLHTALLESHADCVSCSTRQPKSCRMPSMNSLALQKNTGTCTCIYIAHLTCIFSLHSFLALQYIQCTYSLQDHHSQC